MTRMFLAAGVAALALAAPVSAKPGGEGGHGGGNPQAQGGNGGHGGGGEAIQMRSFGGEGRGHGGGPAIQVQRFERHGGGGQAFEAQRFERHGGQRAQGFDFPGRGRGHGGEFQAQRARGFERHEMHGNAMRQVQTRAVERQAIRGNAVEPVQNRGFEREAMRSELRGNAIMKAGSNQALEFRGDRFEPIESAAVNSDNVVRVQQFDFNGRQFAFAPPTQTVQYIGQPLSVVSGFAPLSVVPQPISYLYPDTSAYYYRYGDGYLYQVNRSTSLIDALLPLAFGGYLPGTYFPSSYMNSYVPDYYGLNSFYPSSYDYGYGYGSNLCNRYVNGVIYQVDCATGFIEDAIPVYADGYGVGQMLPSGYGYYNVPYQYRDMYYDTADSNYWYAPGAIYQYDPQTSLITSVAALLTPGFSIGQPLPMGYDAYNVPYAYRSTYYDTPTAWYRYNNGNIYQIDPTTQLVTAIVASILT